MTRNEITAGVLLSGYRSLAAWAKAHGHNPITVRQFFNRYCGNQKRPTGSTTKAIVRDLTITLGQDPFGESYVRRQQADHPRHHHSN